MIHKELSAMFGDQFAKNCVNCVELHIHTLREIHVELEQTFQISLISNPKQGKCALCSD